MGDGTTPRTVFRLEILHTPRDPDRGRPWLPLALAALGVAVTVAFGLGWI